MLKILEKLNNVKRDYKRIGKMKYECPKCRKQPVKTHIIIWNVNEYRLCAYCNSTIEIIGTIIN